MSKQIDILNKIVRDLLQNKKVKGILLIGSVAYSDATDDSDLDLIILCNENKFISEQIDGVLVEKHFHTYANLHKELNNYPTAVYKYLFSKIIFDKGNLKKLINRSKQIYDNYSPCDKYAICYWLSSTKIKLNAALKQNDIMKVSSLLATNTWKLLEGIWLKNQKPMPPSNLAYKLSKNLIHTPFEYWFERLIYGDVLLRANTMLKIIDWILEF